VRLLPARDVRPYVRGNKTGRNDVAGILEADRCAGMAEVPVKTPEQQGIQALHRLREHLKGERTATLNLLRGRAARVRRGGTRWSGQGAGGGTRCAGRR
jgi:transposase